MLHLLRRGRPRGFTLIEILIAMSILSVVIVILGGAMRLGIRSVEKGEREASEIERLRSVVLVMDRQIQSIIPSSREIEGERVVWFEGDERRCLFLTDASLWGRKEGLVEVSYGVEEDGSEGVRMTLQERPPWGEDGLETVLLEGLEEARFAYYYTDQDGEGQWTESWERKDLFPESIALTIRTARYEHRLIFPLMRSGGTGKVTRTEGRHWVEPAPPTR